MNKTIRTLKAALAALTLGVFATAGLQAQIIHNGDFTVGSGSSQGWTLTGGGVGVTYNYSIDEDFLEVRSGGSAAQAFGDGTLGGVGSYSAALGDQITVSWQYTPVWNSPNVDVVLYHSGNISNVIYSQNYPLSGSTYGGSGWTPASFNYTITAANVGQSIGLAFITNGVFADDRVVGIDKVSATVAPIPEPSTYALLGLRLGALAWLRRRRA